MNKAYKYYQPQPINPPKPSTTSNTHPYKQSNFLQTPLKQPQNLQQQKPKNSNNQIQTIIINNIQQQQQLIQNLEWRKKTISPVVKIIQYNVIVSDYQFPKQYIVQFQTIVKQVKNLCQIQLHDSLYLIKNCILGIQTLALNYHYLNLSTIFYGINSKNQCKVWLSNNFGLYKSVYGINYSSGNFILGILQDVYVISSQNCKNNLLVFIDQIKKCQSIGYDGALRRLYQFSKRFRIIIGNSLQHKIQKQPYSNNSKNKQNLQASRSAVSQTGLHQSRKSNTQTKINFRYMSPGMNEMKNSMQPVENHIPWKSCFIQNQKPKINFLYQNSNQILNNFVRSTITSPYNSQVNLKIMPEDIVILQSIIKNQSQQITSNYGIQIQKQQEKFMFKQDSALRKLRQESNLEQTYKKLQNSNQEKRSRLIQTSSIDQFDKNNQNKQIQKQPINQVRLKVQLNIKNNNDVKNSISTTHRSEMAQNSNIQNHIERENSPVVHQQKQKPRNISEFEYNFGGLLPLSCKQILESQIIQQSNKKQSPEKNAFYNNQKTLNFQNFIKPANWDFKVTGLFSQNKKSVLKQSVHCGQDVVKLTSPAVNSKLQKLGQLGRYITSTILTDGQN